jgi:PAS domain S-box-containing protein
MNLHTIAALIMAGITLYVGAAHLLLCRKHMWRRHHFLFALLCLMVAAYDIFSAGLYSSTTIADGMIWQRAQFTAASLMAILIIWFVHDYSSRRTKRSIYIFIVFFLVLGFLGVKAPDSWLFASADSIKHIQLPIYGHITYFEAAPGILLSLLGIAGLISAIYILTISMQGFSHKNKKEYFILIISIIIFTAGVLNDIAVTAGIYKFMYVIEYSYMAIIILMALTLSDEITVSATACTDLRTVEERFRAVFKNAAVGIALVNINKHITIANSAMSGMLGYNEEQLRGMLFYDCMPSNDADEVYSFIDHLLNGEQESWRQELRYKQPGNNVFWGDMSFALVRNSEGEIAGFLWIIVGITERRKAVDALKQLNTELEAKVEKRTTELERSNLKLSRSLDMLEQDEKAGRMLQFNLLPDKIKDIGGYHFERYLAPSLYLSGDFVNYFEIDKDHIGFYMADVSGHGVSSAFITVLLESFIHNHLENYKAAQDKLILNPAKLLSKMNTELLKQNSGKHLTIFYGILSEKDNTMTYTNGGQFPLPILTHNQDVKTIALPGSAIGLFPFSKYENSRIPLPDEFSLVIFSDGILEILPTETLPEKQKYLETLVNKPDINVKMLIEQTGIDKNESLPDDATILLINRRMPHATG